jgi:hypothetical protein
MNAAAPRFLGLLRGWSAGLAACLGDVFFTVGVSASRVGRWIWRWAARPVLCIGAVGVILSHDLWWGAMCAAVLFGANLVYVTLVEMMFELTRADCRQIEFERCEVAGRLQTAIDQNNALRAHRARLALRVSILEDLLRLR